MAGVRNCFDRLIENGFVRRGRFLEARNFPDKLQRRGVHFVAGRVRLKIVELLNISTHNSIIARNSSRRVHFSVVQFRSFGERLTGKTPARKGDGHRELPDARRKREPSLGYFGLFLQFCQQPIGRLDKAYCVPAVNLCFGDVIHCLICDFDAAMQGL